MDAPAAGRPPRARAGVAERVVWCERNIAALAQAVADRDQRAAFGLGLQDALSQRQAGHASPRRGSPAARGELRKRPGLIGSARLRYPHP
jgi:hypothetical protein